MHVMMGNVFLVRPIPGEDLCPAESQEWLIGYSALFALLLSMKERHLYASMREGRNT